MKPRGLFLNSSTVARPMQISKMTINFEAWMPRFTPCEYLSVTFWNHSLNLKNSLLRPRASRVTLDGFSNNVHSAGVNDNATNADNKTDTAIVMANCW